MVPNLPDKQSVARALLLRSASVFVHVNPRVLGTVIPANLRHQDQVVVQIGMDMPVPIPDLVVGDWGIEGTLSFRGIPFTVKMPWKAIFALVGDDAKGMVWGEDMPEAIQIALDAATKLPKKTLSEREVRDAPGARVLSLDDASRRLRGKPLRAGKTVPRRR